MKILHTSDWHLGRQFCGQSLERDHAAILEQVMDALKAHDPDVLIIAGDIFDRASPPADAVRQFNGFIERVASESRAAIVLIAGNHDSGDRIAALAALADRGRVLIRGPLNAEERPLLLHDAHGPVVISALPFGHEFAARECFGKTDIASPADVVAAQVEAARVHVPEGVRWVIVAHAFVSNAMPSDSERRLSVGGIETVPPDVFAGAHYVALGHLHRPQGAGVDHIRYSGPPLAFGFDECGAQKSMTLVELDGDGAVSLETLAFTPVRQVRVVKGAFADLLAAAAASPSDDFFKIVVTDEGALIDPMGRMREHYPNALAFDVDRAAPTAATHAVAGPGDARDNPLAVVEEFFVQARTTPLAEDERPIVVDALGKLVVHEAAA
jgi:exonuclease SbcD